MIARYFYTDDCMDAGRPHGHGWGRWNFIGNEIGVERRRMPKPKEGVYAV
jgi:hypothetical protein